MESDWTDYPLHPANGLPGDVRPWLLDAGSLTQRLIRASGGQFKVQLICHHWQRPRRSEVRLLGMGCRERGIVREVILLCRDQPWVFARSVIPARSLSGHRRRLRTLNDSSLGEMLFRDISMRRSPFQIARIEGSDEQIPATLRQPCSLWGRRCRFELAGKPMMVSEIFLPNFQP